LTLLVSELKNQDPTQPTDPGAYVQQLVGVNSLQQLIEINKGVSSLGTTSTTSS
jgi:flagellar basal-body rod modification protein FlgD